MFLFTEDSAWLMTNDLESALLLLPDEEEERDFLLVGNPTLGLTIARYTDDSLILDEQTAPVIFNLGNGQLGSSEKKVMKSSFLLSRVTDHP